MKFTEILGMAKKPAPAVITAHATTTPPRTEALPAGADLSDDEISALIDKLLGPVQTGPNSYERRPAAGVPPETIAALARQWSEPPTDEELAKLRDCQRRVDAANDAIDAHSRIRSAEAHETSRDAFTLAIAEGRTGDGVELKSRAEWDLHYEERRTAGKIALRQACADAWPTAEVIVKRFAEFARTRCRELEIDDFRRFQALGVAYQPSKLAMTLHDLCAWLEAQLAKVNSRGEFFPTPRAATLGIVAL